MNLVKQEWSEEDQAKGFPSQIVQYAWEELDYQDKLFVLENFRMDLPKAQLQ